MTAIKFNKFAVTNGTDKARVRYYASTLISSGQRAVMLYAKDFQSGRTLDAIMDGHGYENNTDSQTDYYERGLVRILEGSPLYPAALARAQANGCSDF